MNSLWRALLIAAALAVVPLWALGLRAQQSYYGINSPSVDISAAATHTVTVDPGSPASKAGIADGDRIPLAHLDPTTRRQLFSTIALAGVPVSFVVIHDRKSRVVTLKPVAVPVFPLDLSNKIFVAISIICAILGFLIAVRSWDDRRARIAAALLVFLGVEGVTEAAPLQPGSAGVVWLELFWSQAVYVTALATWAFLSVVLVSTYPTARSTAFDYLLKASAALVPLWLVIGLWTTQLLVTSEWTNRTQWLGELYAIPLAVSAAAILVGYFHSSGNDRQRLLWLTLAFVPFQAGVAVLSLASLSGIQLNASLEMRIFELSLPIFMLYGIFVRRVIDVGFIVNRLTVYTVLTALVVATFIVVETLLNTFFVGISHTTSLGVQIGVALILGVTIRYSHRYVDHWVDHILFARRHADEAALRRFAHEAHAYAAKEALLDDALATVREHSDASSVGLYIADGRVVHLARCDEAELPATLDLDDSAMVALRRSHQPVETYGIKTTLPDGMAFPMSARGKLVGVLFCGAKRDATAFAPDEVDPLSELARAVGSALDSFQSPHEDGIAEILNAVRALPDVIAERLKTLIAGR